LFFGFFFGLFFFELLKKFYFFYINKSVFNLFYFFFKKGCFDELYNYYLDKFGNLLYFFVKDIDKGVLELLISFGVVFFFSFISRWYMYFQSGNLVHYLFFFILGFVLVNLFSLVLLFLWVLVC
jgi:NADH:ubiquinone oxidoreductase subunit 5 (subunit L)/multisubunit Na+/H+ antiporter MnhA subunit